MKKFLAIALSLIMIAGIFPAVALAATSYTQSANYTSSNDITAGNEYIIPEGITMTVPSSLTLYIPSGSTLRVAKGGILNVLGTVVVQSRGALIVDGSILHGTNVTASEANAVAVAAVSVAPIAKSLADSITFDDAPYSVSVTATYKGFEGSGSSTASKDFNAADVTAGGTIYAQLNTPVSVSFKINEPFNVETNKEETRYNEKYMPVFVDTAPIDFIQGSNTFTVRDCCAVTFGDAQNDADFYNDCRILLPSGTDFTVVGRNGETGEDGVVYAKYGTYFSFRVELNDTSDRSPVEVRCFNGYSTFGLEVPETGYLADVQPLEPDSQGYYTIYIDGEKTIQVEGTLENGTIDSVSGVMDIIRNILDMITSFFKKIAEFLGFNM